MKDRSKALIFIDLQNDFFPGGALGVKGANVLLPIANHLQNFFPLIIATQDWHPADHKSFASLHTGKKIYDRIDLNGISQVLWPDHCVQGSKGAELHAQLKTQAIHKIIYKGTDPNIDSYSAFFDNAHQKDTGLDAYLKAQGVEEVYILGLATEYCVQYSVLDAVKLGYKTFLIEDACFGIEESTGDIEKAKKTMREAGVIFTDSRTLSEAMQEKGQP